MNAEYYVFPQGSPEWRAIRLGLVTASNIGKLITPTGKPAKNQGVTEYAQKLAAERVNEFADEMPTTFQMNRGHFEEILARDLYSREFAPVTEVGFVTNKIGGVLVGASPDGLVGDDGGIEIKSRLGKFQIATFLNNEVPPEYMLQIQFNLMVTGRDWWDFVQYSNGMRLFVKRVFPNPAAIGLIESVIAPFEEKVCGMVAGYVERSKDFPLAERVPFMDDDENGGIE